MSREILEQLEFEKNKREILKQKGHIKSDPQVKSDIQQKNTAPRIQIENATKYAWEYEIESYRKFKIQMKFLTFGAVCGMIALFMTIGFHFDEIRIFLMKF